MLATATAATIISPSSLHKSMMEAPSLALALFIVVAIINLLRWSLHRNRSGFVHQQRARLSREILALRKQAEAFNNPSTYVKAAKFQRLANAKEKELAALQTVKEVTVQDRVDTTVSTIKVAFICVAVVAWWGKALLHIPPHFTWPFSKLLAFPHASNYLEVGAVTVLPWVAMCDRFSNLLARVVFPERVLDLRTVPLSPVLEEPELQ